MRRGDRYIRGEVKLAFFLPPAPRKFGRTVESPTVLHILFGIKLFSISRLFLVFLNRLLTIKVTPQERASKGFRRRVFPPNRTAFDDAFLLAFAR